MLRGILARDRSTVMGYVRSSFAALGADDPDLATQVLATTYQGLLLHTIGMHVDVDAERVLRSVVAAALAPDAGVSARRAAPGRPRRRPRP